MPGRYHRDPVAVAREVLRAEIEVHVNDLENANRAIIAAKLAGDQQALADAREWADDCIKEAETARSSLASLDMCFL